MAQVARVDRGTIPFHLPALPDVDAFLEDARAIVESGRLSEGPYVRRLESELRPWLGDHEVVAVSNCSDGLIAALSLLARAGAEVIIPGYTYLATWQAVRWAGMVPVVVDVDDRGLIDPDAVEAAIGPRTVAILAVHLTGVLAPMAIPPRDRRSPWNRARRRWRTRHGCPNRRVRGRILGDVEVFSIGATKQVAAGEGRMPDAS